MWTTNAKLIPSPRKRTCNWMRRRTTDATWKHLVQQPGCFGGLGAAQPAGPRGTCTRKREDGGHGFGDCRRDGGWSRWAFVQSQMRVSHSQRMWHECMRVRPGTRRETLPGILEPQHREGRPASEGGFPWFPPRHTRASALISRESTHAIAKPDMKIAQSVTSNHLASSSRACWRVVVNPVPGSLKTSSTRSEFQEFYPLFGGDVRVDV